MTAHDQSDAEITATNTPPIEPINLEHEYVVNLVARALRRHFKTNPGIESLRDVEIAIEYTPNIGYEVFIEKRIVLNEERDHGD